MNPNYEVDPNGLLFATLHIESGINSTTTLITVPAGQTYTIINTFVSAENAGTMVDIICPDDTRMITHSKGTAYTSFAETQLYATVTATSTPVSCYAERESAGNAEHTYYQISYYPYDATLQGRPADASNAYIQLGFDLLIISLTIFLFIKIMTWRNWISEIIKK